MSILEVTQNHSVTHDFYRTFENTQLPKSIYVNYNPMIPYIHQSFNSKLFRHSGMNIYQLFWYQVDCQQQAGDIHQYQD